MRKIKRYKPGELLIIKNNLNKNDRKILDDYITFCSGSASEAKVKIVERELLTIYDTSQLSFDKWTLKDLREFLAILNKSDLANATKNDIKKHFKRFLKEQYDDWNTRFKGLKDPALKCGKDINVEKINENTILQEGELEKLIRGAESLRLKALVILLYETGARPTEVLSTKWKDIDLDKGEIKLLSTKNNTVRVVPIKESILHLQRYKQEFPYPNVVPNDFIFPSPRDRKEHFSIQYLQNIFAKLSEQSLGRKLFPYILRHTRATELQKVLTPKIYEKVMDHSIEMATRYSHLNKDDVREQMLERVYHIEELTKEERSEIEKLKNKIESMKGEYTKEITELKDLFLKFAKGEITYSLEDDEFTKFNKGKAMKLKDKLK